MESEHEQALSFVPRKLVTLAMYYVIKQKWMLIRSS